MLLIWAPRCQARLLGRQPRGLDARCTARSFHNYTAYIFFSFFFFFSPLSSNVLIVRSKGRTKAKENYTLLITGSVVFHRIPVNCSSSVNAKKKKIADGCKDANILKIQGARRV